MEIIDQIKEIDSIICRNIDDYKSDRGFLSQNVLPQLRNFVEAIALKIYATEQNKNLDLNYNNIKIAIAYIKTRAKLKFLAQFHRFLQNSVSHYTIDEENSQRLMLKYYEFLLKIKKFLKQNYNINIIKNINKFPINTDSNLKEYYEKIAENILKYGINEENSYFDGRYYIEKIKPFFVNHEIFYEITFTEATNWSNKTDAMIAFTKLDLLKNYSVKLSFHESNISVLRKNNTNFNY